MNKKVNFVSYMKFNYLVNLKKTRENRICMIRNKNQAALVSKITFISTFIMVVFANRRQSPVRTVTYCLPN